MQDIENKSASTNTSNYKEKRKKKMKIECLDVARQCYKRNDNCGNCI